MSQTPEIAPEIRGLLEEIVADPRSSIRLVPQRALRSWFERGEPVRAREVAETRAERHLIEVHREALARVLWDASQIAYWKAPRLAHKPVGLDGKRYDPVENEPEWRERGRSILTRTREAGSGVDLLRACLDGMESGLAFPLAQAALSLVRSDLNRLNAAFRAPSDQPRTAIALYGRMVAQAPVYRDQVHMSVGSRLCQLGQFHAARQEYRSAGALELSREGQLYAFHLSCLILDESGALSDASSLRDMNGGDPLVVEVSEVLRKWTSGRPRWEAKATRDFVAMISSRLSEGPLSMFEAAYS